MFRVGGIVGCVLDLRWSCCWGRGVLCCWGLFVGVLGYGWRWGDLMLWYYDVRGIFFMGVNVVGIG